MPLLFAATLFLSAFLLFLIQPLVGRMLLPLLGGSPAVWNACMVFFQAALLAGYAYAHVVTARLGRRAQIILQAFMLCVPAFLLPIAISDEAARAAAETRFPIFLVLRILAVAVGLPFLVIATTGPLLQRWFANTGHPSGRDPYFLYAASNFGSMLALVAYPALFEPLLRLADQSAVWTIGYGVYVVLVIACGLALWNAPRTATVLPPGAKPVIASTPLTWPRRARWVLLAFVPSSLLLGTTTYLSTDIAPIPLLWVIPLAIYLLTFMLVFAKKPPVPHAWMNRLLPIAVLMLTLVLLTGATELRGLPVGVLLGLHLLAFFLAAMVAHGELARDRPSAEYLTEFYIWLSVGGVLGGMFNTLLAPALFHNGGLVEYPFALVLACLLRSPRTEVSQVAARRGRQPMPKESPDNEPASSRTRLGLDIGIALAIALVTWGLAHLATTLKLDAGPIRTAVMFGLPCVLVYVLVDRPVRFALGIGALLLVGAFDPDQTIQHRERNFFGVLRVTEANTPEAGRFRVLYHGNTIHGQQSLEHVDSEGRHEPLTYYFRTGPIGHVFENWLKARPPGQQVGAVGLGTGSLAYYARPDDDWTFYEIDPAIQRVAEDPRYFSFLSECRARNRRVILGDARLRLREAPDHAYDLLVLDAFSSDAIPMHLITKEALQLYLDKLANGGMIAIHVSNRYLRLQPILAKLAESVNPPLVIRHWDDPDNDSARGKSASQWVILARSEADLGRLAHGARWEKLRPEPDTPLWTDDFSNLLSAIDW